MNQSTHPDTVLVVVELGVRCQDLIIVEVNSRLTSGMKSRLKLDWGAL